MEDPVAPDDCYRCGYDLRGIADDQACPECGLLAQRSRRETDELHLTRPNWLKRLSLGVWIILLSLGAFVAWLALQETLRDAFYASIQQRALTPSLMDLLQRAFMLLLAAIPLALLVSGCWLLTTPEGYPPADSADRRRRRIVRLTALLPIIVTVLRLVMIEHAQPRPTATWTREDWNTYEVFQKVDLGAMVACILTFAFVPLPLFLQLRNLARRARSAHLAEHCVIVGIEATLAVTYMSFVYALNSFHRELGLGPYWESRSTWWLVFLLIAGVMANLLILWSLYLLIRFAIAFRKAARHLRSVWQRDDRSLSAHPDH